MPVSVVKTPADEKDWEKAKKIVEKQYGSAEGKWGLVMTIFKNKQKARSRAKKAAMFQEMARRIAFRIITAGKWKSLPKGWTQESLEKFWDSLAGEGKHPVSTCIDKMDGKVDDPGAFCAAARDRATGSTAWRSEG